MDFSAPRGEPALVPADSVAWRVFKNPVALYVGGVTAVLLELAEPRVRSGVWDHTDFRTDPVGRMQRTGLAAMTTVYGARGDAERLIARVTKMHAEVRGTTPDGVSYRALDQDLLVWVHATAAFGFLHAYHHYVRPLRPDARDAFYAEFEPAGQLYGARRGPRSESDQHALFEDMLPALEPSPIVFEFIEIVSRAATLPRPLRFLQPIVVRAAVELLPPGVRERLGLGPRHALKPWERRLLAGVGRISDRIPIPSAPPAQACVRLGLPANHLYRRTRS